MSSFEIKMHNKKFCGLQRFSGLTGVYICTRQIIMVIWLVRVSPAIALWPNKVIAYLRYALIRYIGLVWCRRLIPIEFDELITSQQNRSSKISYFPHCLRAIFSTVNIGRESPLSEQLSPASWISYVSSKESLLPLVFWFLDFSWSCLSKNHL